MNFIIKNFKVALLSSVTIFLFHYLFGVIYTYIIGSKGIHWMNPFLVFIIIGWIYILTNILYLYFSIRSNFNRWSVASTLIMLLFIGQYIPSIIDGTFERVFKWGNVLLFMVTIPMLIYVNNYYLIKIKPSN